MPAKPPGVALVEAAAELRNAASDYRSQATQSERDRNSRDAESLEQVATWLDAVRREPTP